jgi:hypothetical protein
MSKHTGILSTTLLPEGCQYDSSVNGKAVYIKLGGDSWRNVLAFDSPQALEEFYDFLGGVMAGLRFDAMTDACAVSLDEIANAVAEASLPSK